MSNSKIDHRAYCCELVGVPRSRGEDKTYGYIFGATKHAAEQKAQAAAIAERGKQHFSAVYCYTAVPTTTSLDASGASGKLVAKLLIKIACK